MKIKRLPLLMVVIVMLSGCSAFSYTKSLFVSGVSLEVLGTHFVQTTEHVTAGCDAKVIPAVTCDKYRAFGLHFKRVYPLTVGMWRAARNAGDATAKGKAEDVARSLAKDLTTLAVEALGTFAPKGD